MSDLSLTYREFDLRFTDHVRQAGASETFSVTLAAVGEDVAQAPVAASEVPSGFHERVAALREPASRSTVRACGVELGDLMLPPGSAVRERFLETRRRLGDAERIRLRLRFGAELALAGLPWEFAVIEDGAPVAGEDPGAYLGLDGLVSIVRREEDADVGRDLTPLDPKDVGVVCLLANPRDPTQNPLDTEKERASIQTAMDRQRIAPQFVEPPTKNGFSGAMISPFIHAFHFGGHGRFTATGRPDEEQGWLVLENDQGGPDWLGGQDVALALAGKATRLVVLSACESAGRDESNAWSGVVPAIARIADVPAVVGMRIPVRDEDACLFLHAFYEVIAAGHPVDEAVRHGRLEIARHHFEAGDINWSAWGIPSLYLSTGEGTLFPTIPVTGEWRSLSDAASAQARGAVSRLRGSDKRVGRYVPEAYVERNAANAALREFLRQDRPGLVVTGPAGSGKTSLMCRWWESKHDDDAVLFYDCSGIDGDLGERLAKDLRLPGATGVVEALRDRARGAPAGGHLIVVVDAVNEARTPGGPAGLVTWLDELVGGLRGSNVRVVLTCTDATWNSLGQDGAPRLQWDAYYQPGEATSTLSLPELTDAELTAAIDRYRRLFDLAPSVEDLSPASAETLRNPLVLRLFAEAYKRRRPVPRDVGSTVSIFQEFYISVTSLSATSSKSPEADFLLALADVMLGDRSSSPARSRLAQVKALRAQMREGDASTAFFKLVDRGVLTRTLDMSVMEDVVSFTDVRFGAYVLALRIWREAQGSLSRVVRDLVRDVDAFAPAWDTAKFALVLAKDAVDLKGLAAAKDDPSLNELAAEALEILFADDPAFVSALLQELLADPGAEAPETGLRALHALGPRARAVYEWIPRHVTQAEVRRAATFSLYLWWQQAPDLPFAVLRSLVPLTNPIGAATTRRIRALPENLATSKRVLEYLGDVTVNVYINHCEDEALTIATSDLWRSVLKDTLHLDKVNRGPVPRVAVPLLAKLFAGRIMSALSLSRATAKDDPFFAVPPERRTTFRAVVPLCDPDVDLPAASDWAVPQLAALLDSPSSQDRILAALVLAIHGFNAFDRVEPVIRAVRDAVATDGGRVWHLLAFGVLLADPTVAASWLPMLEEETTDVVRNVLADGARPLPISFPGLDPTLLPLGLAYGASGRSPRTLEETIDRVLAAGNEEAIGRMLGALGAVGLTYPELVFRLLLHAQPHLPAGLTDELAAPLAAVRSLRPAQTDEFMRRFGFPAPVQREARERSGPELVRESIYLLGIYNNAVHQALRYPLMRREILGAALRILADAKTRSAFVSAYGRQVLKMVRESDYELVRWTTIR